MKKLAISDIVKIIICTMFRSPERVIDFFDIVAGILQEDILLPFLFIICLDYVQGMSVGLKKENGFTHRHTHTHNPPHTHPKEESRRYPAEIITDANYAPDLALLTNTPAQIESLSHSLEQAANSIGLCELR